jgi:hypothetical protein
MRTDVRLVLARMGSHALLIGCLTGSSVVSAQTALKDLNASDPPSVIRLDHNENLTTLREDHDRTIQAINAQAGDTARACSTKLCVTCAWDRAAKQRDAETQRYAVAVDAETLRFNEALKGAEERLADEETARQETLARQKQDLARRRGEMAAALDRQRRETIGSKAQSSASAEAFLQESGAGIETPARPGPFGDVSSRFKPRRREYAAREWPDGGDEAGAVDRECRGAGATTRTCRERAIRSEIAELEANVPAGPRRADVEKRLKGLRSELDALAAVGEHESERVSSTPPRGQTTKGKSR